MPDEQESIFPSLTIAESCGKDIAWMPTQISIKDAERIARAAVRLFSGIGPMCEIDSAALQKFQLDVNRLLRGTPASGAHVQTMNISNGSTVHIDVVKDCFIVVNDKSHLRVEKLYTKMYPDYDKDV